MKTKNEIRDTIYGVTALMWVLRKARVEAGRNDPLLKNGTRSKKTRAAYNMAVDDCLNFTSSEEYRTFICDREVSRYIMNSERGEFDVTCPCCGQGI
jgi:hypothetical protein